MQNQSSPLPLLQPIPPIYQLHCPVFPQPNQPHKLLNIIYILKTLHLHSLPRLLLPCGTCLPFPNTSLLPSCSFHLDQLRTALHHQGEPATKSQGPKSTSVRGMDRVLINLSPHMIILMDTGIPVTHVWESAGVWLIGTHSFSIHHLYEIRGQSITNKEFTMHCKWRKHQVGCQPSHCSGLP